MATITRSKIPPRIVKRNRKVHGIESYDFDNGYPQRVTDIVNASGLAKQVVALYARFIEGKGFRDLAFYKQVINNSGMTLDKLLSFLAFDLAMRNGFAIHFNYNAMYQITEMRPVKFEDLRRVDPTCPEYSGKIALYKDWYCRQYVSVKKEEIKFIDLFNPDAAAIEMQVEKAKGWANYKGQILWHSQVHDDYPLAPYDAVLEDIETDGRIKRHKRNKAATGFNADYMFVHVGMLAGEKERTEIIESIEEHQGDDSAGSVMLIEVKSKDDIPQLLPFEKSSDKGDFYTSNESSVQNNIRKAILPFPPCLVGEYQASGITDLSKQIIESCTYINGLVDKERRLMEETFQKISPLFFRPLNTTNDYSIIPLELVMPPAVSPATPPPTNVPNN